MSGKCVYALNMCVFLPQFPVWKIKKYDSIGITWNAVFQNCFRVNLKALFAICHKKIHALLNVFKYLQSYYDITKLASAWYFMS